MEEIADINGVDILFVGRSDLGNSIGRPIKDTYSLDPEAAISRVLRAALTAGKKAGIDCADGQMAAR